MSGISTPPFRLLMEELGAGGSVSELVSAHGINHGNRRTQQMLIIHPREKNTGIQLFGEDADSLAQAAKIAEQYGPKFIDINMGCPVKKVVKRGAGSALLKDTAKLGHFFATIKKSISIPLSIKIRTGWDESSRNAAEVISIAFNEGVEFVAVHGRTRAQQYKGSADWDYLEHLAIDAPLPIIGNGDLHTKKNVRERYRATRLDALMLGRGPLRNPFLFLESLSSELGPSFTPKDFWEVANILAELFIEYFEPLKLNPLLPLKKHVTWLMHGFEGASRRRQSIFEASSTKDVLVLAKNYFFHLESTGVSRKEKKEAQTFMAGGHG